MWGTCRTGIIVGRPRGQPMTEEEWLTCDDSTAMLEALRQDANERKLWLFAVACCRRVWDLLTDARSQRAVEVLESYADNSHNHDELAAAALAANAPDLEATSLDFR